jgi:hypothetical protein
MTLSSTGVEILKHFELQSAAPKRRLVRASHLGTSSGTDALEDRHPLCGAGHAQEGFSGAQDGRPGWEALVMHRYFSDGPDLSPFLKCLHEVRHKAAREG